MTAQCAIFDRPFTIDDLPELLPAVMTPCYDTVVPAVLGAEPVTLPAQFPSRLPALAARRVAVVLAGQRAEHDAAGAADESESEPAAAGAAWVIDERACERLLGFLAQVQDRRDPRGVRYPLPYLLAVPIVAMMAHETQMNGIGEWVADAPEELLLALGAPTGPGGSARRPDAKTLTDALAVHGEDYDRALCAFAGALARDHHHHQQQQRRSLHIDGKAQKGATPRGGRTPMLLAARFDDGTVPAQHVVPVDKSNEITVFRPLLDQIPDADLAGTVATGDQLHTQRGHALYLHERGAFYVFTVGGNQPRLFQALDALPWRHIAVDHATIDRGHGRIEIRTIQTLPATGKIKNLFPHVAQVFLIERHIYDTHGTPLGTVAVLGITSLPADDTDGAALLACVRGHWGIESLHWLRDRVLGEDDSKLKSASRAMAALRNMVISVCCLRGITRISRALRDSGRAPYQRPLALLGLTKPASDLTET